jgi:L-2-hydroxyglutarate oxidase LhgO
LDSDLTIIGAGVVGLAIAAKMSALNDSLFVIERYKKFGQESSSRNSEVVHSGIYYPSGSLKARLCVEGREKLYHYCDRNEIAYKKCGKLIVATDDSETEQLSGILMGARANGVMDAFLVDRQQIQELEPHIRAQQGIFFPSTGIVDSYSLMKQLETDSIRNGVNFVYNAEVLEINRIEGGYEISMIDADGEKFSFTSEMVVNSAGLSATRIARSVGIYDPNYHVYYWKGEYFSLGNGKHKLINRLIYPVPEKNRVGLGIHTTINLDGRVKLGPNALYLENNEPEYSVDPGHANQFYHSAKKFLPFLEAQDLYPDQAGIRPKLQKPGDPVMDFLIKEESERNLPGLVNLIGIESPGLTASLSIAEYVSTLLPPCTKTGK